MTVHKRLLTMMTVLALTGCADPPVDGVVAHKQHSDAYDYVTMVCGAYDSKTFACTVWIPISNHMPASWQLCVQGVDKNGKDAEGCIEVAQQTYDRYSEGSHYSARGDR